MPELKPLTEIIKALSEPIADRHLETRKQGSANLTYISWHNALRYLDLKAPGWCYEVTKIHTDEKRIYIVVRITIQAQEGTFYREATGTEELNCSSYGDPSSNAESMALRRAAAKWGLGLYLYDKTGVAARSNPQAPMRVNA
jgi:hypothetical protein